MDDAPTITTETSDWLQEPFESFLHKNKSVVVVMDSVCSPIDNQIYLTLYNMVNYRENLVTQTLTAQIEFSFSKKPF